MMFVIIFVVAFAAAKGLFFFRSHPHDIGQPALGSRLLGRVADLISIAQSCLLATTEALPHWLDKASINVNMFVLHPETMALHDPRDNWANRGASSCTRGCFSVFQKKVIASRSKLLVIVLSSCQVLYATHKQTDENDANALAPLWTSWWFTFKTCVIQNSIFSWLANTQNLLSVGKQWADRI